VIIISRQFASRGDLLPFLVRWYVYGTGEPEGAAPVSYHQPHPEDVPKAMNLVPNADHEYSWSPKVDRE
jgi:hypothetical protein